MSNKPELVLMRSDAELIGAVRRGDVASFEPLIAKYQARIFATARRYALRDALRFAPRSSGTRIIDLISNAK